MMNSNPEPEPNPEPGSADETSTAHGSARGGGDSPFTATSWSMLARAPFCPETLGAVIARYEPAAVAWCRAALGPEGEDVFQQFVAKLLRGPHPLGSIDPDKGRFRDWLRQALRNECAGMRRAASALKRGGGRTPEPLEPELRDPDAADPAEDFDRRYAARLMEIVTERLFSGLEPDSLDAGIARIMFGPDEERVRRFLAERGIGSSTFYARRDALREQFQNLLRQEVADSLTDPTQEKIDGEIGHLRAVLRNAPR